MQFMIAIHQEVAAQTSTHAVGWVKAGVAAHIVQVPAALTLHAVLMASTAHLQDAQSVYFHTYLS